MWSGRSTRCTSRWRTTTPFTSNRTSGSSTAPVEADLVRGEKSDPPRHKHEFPSWPSTASWRRQLRSARPWVSTGRRTGPPAASLGASAERRRYGRPDLSARSHVSQREGSTGTGVLGLGASVTILIASTVSIMTCWRSHLRSRPPNPFSMMTQPMRLTPADASAARASDNGRDVLGEWVRRQAVRSHT